MKYKQLVNELLENVGGAENIAHLTHCATRLRFQLVDVKKANLEKLSKLEGVIDAFEGNDEVQVIIGPDVPFVFKEVQQVANLSERNKEVKVEEVKKKEGLGTRIVGLISGTFSSLLPVIIGCGMVKALALLLWNFGIMDPGSSTFAVINAIGNAGFYFLPIFIGFSAAQRLGANPFMGAVICAVLLEPSYTSLVSVGTAADFFGIKLYLVNYASTIIPAFIAVVVYYFLEKWLNKILHKNLKTVFAPTIALLVVVPLTLLVFGPIGSYAAELFSSLFAWLYETNSILLGAVYGGYVVFGVMFGFGWINSPIMLQNLAAQGFDPLQAMGAAYNFAIFGIAFGFFLKARDEETKSVAMSSLITGLLAGISEPTLYGLVLKHSRTLPMLVICSIIGGGIMGALNVVCVGYVFTNIFTIGSFTPIVSYIVTIALSFIMGTASILIFGYGEKK